MLCMLSCVLAAEYLVVPGLAVETQSASSGIGTLHIQFVHVKAGQLPRGVVKNGYRMESMRVTSLSWLAPVRHRWWMRSRLVFRVSHVCVLPAVSLRLARRSELLSMVSQATWKSKSVWIRFTVIHICAFDLISVCFLPFKLHFFQLNFMFVLWWQRPLRNIFLFTHFYILYLFALSFCPLFSLCVFSVVSNIS